MSMEPAVPLARLETDASLREERVQTDVTLAESLARGDGDEARESRKRGIESLLTIERENTDRHLFVERARADMTVEGRDNFLAMVAHDLRSLLSAIALNTRLLVKHADGPGTLEKRLKAAKTIEFSREVGIPTGLGLRDDVPLEARSSIEPSMRPLMDLSSRTERLRTQVLDVFDGRTWRTSRELMVAHPASQDDHGTKAHVTITMLDELGGHVPSPAGFVSVDQEDLVEIGGHVVRGHIPQGARITFSLGEDVLPLENPPNARMLSMPRELAELRDIAGPIVAGAANDRERADRIAHYFSDHFFYSLDTNLVGKEHPILVLIKEKRPAYCVYFASAMALMMRSIGVPARVIGGFVPEEENLVTGRTLVRERDAHAWVEVWIPEEKRFVPFDPTPWQGRESALGLDEKHGFLADVVKALRELWARVYVRLRYSPSDVLLDLAKSPVFIALVAAFLIWQWRKRQKATAALRVRSALATENPILRSAHARYVRALAKAGITMDAVETEDDVLARIRVSRGENAADAAHAFLALYRRARFRNDALDEKALQSAVKAVENTLQRAAPP